jgi:hypothetical protein
VRIKDFFSEEKKQKTFMPAQLDDPGDGISREAP